MHSPAHHDNLLNPAVNRVGIAVVAGPQGLYAVADYERGVEQLSQTQVEAMVAQMLLASGITVQPDPALARVACAMDDGMPRSASSPHPRFVMRWQSSELKQLPKTLVNELATESYHQAAVGNCPADAQQGPFSGYRLAVLLY